MKNLITINGIEIKLTPEQCAEVGLMDEHSRCHVAASYYYCITDTGVVMYTPDMNTGADRDRHRVGNYFHDEKTAMKARLRVYRALAENKGGTQT